jgi:hypothetical protein
MSKLKVNPLKKSKKVILGWREIISIPELGIKEIKAKLDTGARTSALHVSNLKIIKRSKTQFAEFTVHPKQHSAKPEIHTRHKISSFRIVKSSNGQSSKRPVIKANVVLGLEKKEIEITLVNRDLMGFRLLIGRTALKPKFIVDPGKSFLSKKTTAHKN